MHDRAFDKWAVALSLPRPLSTIQDFPFGPIEDCVSAFTKEQWYHNPLPSLAQAMDLKAEFAPGKECTRPGRQQPCTHELLVEAVPAADKLNNLLFVEDTPRLGPLRLA